MLLHGFDTENENIISYEEKIVVDDLDNLYQINKDTYTIR